MEGANLCRHACYIYARICVSTCTCICMRSCISACVCTIRESVCVYIYIYVCKYNIHMYVHAGMHAHISIIKASVSHIHVCSCMTTLLNPPNLGGDHRTADWLKSLGPMCTRSRRRVRGTLPSHDTIKAATYRIGNLKGARTQNNSFLILSGRFFSRSFSWQETG